MTRVEQFGSATLYLGDSVEVLEQLHDIDVCVTDPPYGLSFMGKAWDYDVPKIELWQRVLAALKPGAHLLSFAGSRTYHRMAVAIEDAGFELRDQIMWIYGSGFPKSLDVSKAIDKAAGAERKVVGTNPNSRPNMVRVEAKVLSPRVDAPLTAPATDAARQWQGWGTALKPSHEPICLARKPLSEKNVAANVLEHGTGALNIDGCRVEVGEDSSYAANCSGDRGHADNRSRDAGFAMGCGKASQQGRWPANIVHDGSDEVVAGFPAQAGAAAPVHRRNADKFRSAYGAFAGNIDEEGSTFRGDSGSAARFFYCAKASKADRDEGMEGIAEEIADPYARHRHRRMEGDAVRMDGAPSARRANHHPTVKPTALMRYLCRLVTRPGGTILDPFMGSGSTGKAAIAEGFHFVGIERDPAYFDIACRRIEAAERKAIEELMA